MLLKEIAAAKEIYKEFAPHFVRHDIASMHTSLLPMPLNELCQTHTAREARAYETSGESCRVVLKQTP